MLLRKIITCILLLTLCIQILPVRQMGALLFSNQINEELSHDLISLKEVKLKCTDSEFLLTFCAPAINANWQNASAYLHYSAVIPNNHTAEIHTPPPNEIA